MFNAQQKTDRSVYPIPSLSFCRTNVLSLCYIFWHIFFHLLLLLHHALYSCNFAYTGSPQYMPSFYLPFRCMILKKHFSCDILVWYLKNFGLVICEYFYQFLSSAFTRRILAGGWGWKYRPSSSDLTKNRTLCSLARLL